MIWADIFQDYGEVFLLAFSFEVFEQYYTGTSL